LSRRTEHEDSNIPAQQQRALCSDYSVVFGL